MPDQELPSPGIGALAALTTFIVAAGFLGWLAQRAVRRGSFVQGYFLGNRGLGSWALALTATVQSGGTFMGFPSLVYSYGWIVALWIASYMVVPITGFGLLGKRIADLSRRTGAITVPDLFRERFGEPRLGLAASLFILLFMSAMMVAQFKAGAIVMKLAWPGSGSLALSEEGGIDQAYYVGLAIFSVTVVGYTLIGGFLAAVWTDVLQSIMMLVGVLILLCLALPAAGGLENATRTAIEHTGPDFAFGPGFSREGRAFLPLGLALSFFVVWIFGGIGNPASIVRVMAVKNTATVRRSIFLLNTYNVFIYPPLIVICICAMVVMPNVAKSDEIIPRMALWTTRDLPMGSLLAGLILAAPFGAIMSTVSSFLVVISAGLVRDLYQRFLNPRASAERLRWLSYAAMLLVGGFAVAANLRPVAYLQALVVFSGSGVGATFFAPACLACYWKRATAAGALAAMFVGAGITLTLYVIGFFAPDPMIGPATAFRPYYLLGVEPIVWALPGSFLAGIGVSLRTTPPDEHLLERAFGERERKNGEQ